MKIKNQKIELLNLKKKIMKILKKKILLQKKILMKIK